MPPRLRSGSDECYASATALRSLTQSESIRELPYVVIRHLHLLLVTVLCVVQIFFYSEQVKVYEGIKTCSILATFYSLR